MSVIKVLGAYSTIDCARGTSSYLISPSVAIDAGNLLRGLGEEAVLIDHIILTHCHMEHICDIPFLIDLFYTQRKTPLNIYGLSHTMQHFQAHIFNNDIWPDFSKIHLVNSDQPSVIFHEIKPHAPFKIGDILLKPILTTHVVPTVGYVITKENSTIYLAGDTHICDAIWNEINGNKNISTVIVECTYPTAMTELAKTHGHLTPTLLREELLKLKRGDVNFYITHLNPMLAGSIIYELSNHPMTVDMIVLDDADEIKI